MDFLHSLILLTHLIGAAALVGGWLATFRSPTVLWWQHLGAWLQLISGVLLVGLLEMNDGGPVNHMKIAVKLAVVIAVVIVAIIGRRKVKRDEPVSAGVAHAVGGLALINMAIAVLW